MFLSHLLHKQLSKEHSSDEDMSSDINHLLGCQLHVEASVLNCQHDSTTVLAAEVGVNLIKSTLVDLTMSKWKPVGSNFYTVRVNFF